MSSVLMAVYISWEFPATVLFLTLSVLKVSYYCLFPTVHPVGSRFGRRVHPGGCPADDGRGEAERTAAPHRQRHQHSVDTNEQSGHTQLVTLQ